MTSVWTPLGEFGSSTSHQHGVRWCFGPQRPHWWGGAAARAEQDLEEEEEETMRSVSISSRSHLFAANDPSHIHHFN